MVLVVSIAPGWERITVSVQTRKSMTGIAAMYEYNRRLSLFWLLT